MTKKEILKLQNLANTVRSFSETYINEKHKGLWKSMNDNNMTIPTVLARDYPIALLNINDELTPTIEDPFFRQVELDLLLKIYEWKHMRCHRVLEPVIYCQASISDDRFGIKMSAPEQDELLHHNGFNTARHFDRQIKQIEDLDKIKSPVIQYDEETTAEHYEAMQDIFGGILAVKLHGIDHFLFAPWDDLMSWMGFEEGLMDLVLQPEMMHAAIRRYVDFSIVRAKEYELLGLVSSNNTNALVGQGGYGYCSTLPLPTESGIGAKLEDNWGDARDQIFTSVSPDMTNEFAFRYEKDWLDLFGLNYFGCCENLYPKLDGLKQLPKLNKVSLSPYAPIEETMERVNGEMIISFKADSIHLTGSKWNREELRKEIIDACSAANRYHCSMEIIMKTIITLNNDPKRLWDWCELAVDIVENY